MNVRLWSVAAICLAVNACGFHLRDTRIERFPKDFAVMRVTLTDRLAVRHEPLRQAVENALRHDAGVTLTDSEKVPTLVLDAESIASGAVSINRSGLVAEYRVSYTVSFRLINAEGRELLPSQTIRLVRDYVYDPRGVIGKEKEDLDLRETMRRDAASQIVRRVSRAPTVPPASNAKDTAQPPAASTP